MKILPRSLGLLLALVAVRAVSAEAQPPVPAAKPVAAKIGSSVFKWEDLKVRPTAVGERRDVADNPTATLEVFESHITTLNPGKASHLPHTHAQEEMIILKEGTLEVSLNGTKQQAGPGSLLFFASNNPHAVQNVGDKPATYFVFNFATAATRAMQGHAAPLKALGKLGATVFDWTKLVAKPTKTGERREVVDLPSATLSNFECHVTTLRAGEAPHAAHRHPDEEIILIKEGLLEVTINGVSQRAGAGSILFYSSGDEHGMKNVGDTAATYYVIRLITEATPKAAPQKT